MFAQRAGFKGLLVPVPASEVLKLTFEERLKMVKAVLKAKNDKIPVFAGTGARNFKQPKLLLDAYLDLELLIFLVQIPFNNENQFKRH